MPAPWFAYFVTAALADPLPDWYELWEDHPHKPALSSRRLACTSEADALTCIARDWRFEADSSVRAVFSRTRIPHPPGVVITAFVQPNDHQLVGLDNHGTVWTALLDTPGWTKLADVPTGNHLLATNGVGTFFANASTVWWWGGYLAEMPVKGSLALSPFRDAVAFRTVDGQVGTLSVPLDGPPRVDWYDGLRGASDVALSMAMVCGILENALRCASMDAPSVEVPFAEGRLWRDTGRLTQPPKVDEIVGVGIALMARTPDGEVIMWRPGDPGGQVNSWGAAALFGGHGYDCIATADGRWWCSH